MKFKFQTIIKPLLLVCTALVLLTSCNKDVQGPTPIILPTPAANSSVMFQVNTDASLTLLKAAVARAGLTALLTDSTAGYTFFAPTDAAFQAAGLSSTTIINAQRVGFLDTLLRYHIVGGQTYTSSIIPSAFPNISLPSMLIGVAPSAALPPGFRLPVFPSKRGTSLWVNNVPITQADITVSNGVMHKTAALLLPPSGNLWDSRINTDANLAYFKAAVQRADSGATASQALIPILQNSLASLTVFAPTNTAFQQALTAQIAAALIAQGVPSATAQAQATALASTPGVFTNPAVANVLTPTVVKGLVVYHILGVRAFSVNIPSTATTIPTLLNMAAPTHPGVIIQATFSGPAVTAATVKGLVNTTASNIQINPTPGTGTSDQHYTNGVLHVIDQVLRPQ